MENGSLHEEPHKRKSHKRTKNKNKQATVLKQLNNQNLYPIQERIGIYVVAALSVLGLVLITYTGVMAIVSNAENESSYTSATDVDVDVDEVSDMLDDLDDLFQDEDDQYADGSNEEDEQNEGGGSVGSANDAPTGIINDNMVHLWREPGSPDAMLSLQEGYVVILIDLDYNDYWSHVEVETDVIDGITALRGFVLKEFIDVQ